MADSSCRAMVREVKRRLQTVLDKPHPGYVRIVAMPNPRDATYRASNGIAVAVGPPDPDERSGAGRRGMKVKRALIVFVTSLCLQDAAGEDEVAVLEHLDLEEAIVDALLDRHPSVPASQVGITCNWTAGGDTTARAVRKDTGLLTSTLTFTVTYPASLSV